MSLTQPTIWSTGSFERDSVIYAMGSLAEVVLGRARAEPRARGRYRVWIESLVDGADADRECPGPRFEGLALLGVDQAMCYLQGVFVASFRGDEAVASAFALAIARAARDAAQHGVGQQPDSPGQSTATLTSPDLSAFRNGPYA